MRTTRWRGGLPVEARRAFCELYQVGEYDLGDGRKIRAASIPDPAKDGSRIVIVDPIDASDTPSAWECVKMQPPPAAYDLYRCGQVLAHRDAERLGWGWTRGQFAGRPAYIVGSGPSALRAREAIPRRGVRRGLVFAINNAAKIFPGDHDFWCLGDALWPDRQPEWQARLLAEWAEHDHTGAWGLFMAYANARAVAQFHDRGGMRADFYLGYNANPYRKLAGADLPGFITGLQAIVEVVHAAAWLGCVPIVLFGVDEAREVSGATHAIETVGWRTGTTPTTWQRHPGLFGNVETCPQFTLTAMILSAEGAFLQDAEIPVFNASSGLDLLFALYLDPAEAVWLCEEGDDASRDEVRAQTPSLGRRARPVEPTIVLS